MASVGTFPRGKKDVWATLTEPVSGVCFLEMHNFTNNRLEPGGSLVITGEREVGKFFSNGLNLDCLPSYLTFFGDYYYKLLSRVITFPLTTIGAINGHCFAGGLCLALSCDWRICRASFALTLAQIQTRSLIRPKLRSVPDSGSEATIAFAVNKAAEMASLAASGVLRTMKQTLYATALILLVRKESPTAGMPQRENAKAFEAPLAAEIAAKLSLYTQRCHICPLALRA
ncbi:hypothetical protein JCM3774_004749 [Rhodotorula dairenensis]